MLLLLSLIFFSLTLGFLVFFLFRCCSLSFFVFLFLFLFLFLLCITMAFYTVCRNRIYHFYPLTTFGMLWVSFQDCPMVYWLPNHRHYTVLAVPCLIPKQKWFCFVLYFPWHSHPDKSGASLLPTSITCTSWFQLMFASFGWDVIPARHFPQKSLNGNPKIGSPFSPPPDHTPSYLLPLTCGLPPLY